MIMKMFERQEKMTARREQKKKGIQVTYLCVTRLCRPRAVVGMEKKAPTPMKTLHHLARARAESRRSRGATTSSKAGPEDTDPIQQTQGSQRLLATRRLIKAL